MNINRPTNNVTNNIIHLYAPHDDNTIKQCLNINAFPLSN